MQRLNFTIIKLTFFLVLGILLGYVFKVNTNISIIISISMLLLTFVIYLIEKQKLQSSILFSIAALLSMLFIGVSVENIHNQSQWKDHYSNSEVFQPSKRAAIKIKITEILKPSKYQDKYIAHLISFNGKRVQGKLLVNIDVDSLQPTLKVDDIIATKTEFKEIAKPLNPYQFDYSEYLKKKYIYHQIYTSSNKILALPNKKTSILGIANNVRSTINERLDKFNFKPDQLAIINAILLGQRKDLSKAMYQQYASAGAIHILAVSGLHVGIILLLLQFLLKPLEHLKSGRTLKLILIVAILWLFAIVAGLSASVVRAVTMFSIVAVGLNLKRPTSTYNTLVISMFVLLLFKPMFLFDVGFQLSYVAVFAIVWIQPMLYKLWSPKFKIIDYFWQIFTVTLAAQIGVAPLSLFYFHQFPGLFFVTNLVIIPVLGLILGVGILVILLSLLNMLPKFMAEAYGKVISLLNNFVSWVAEQEAFLFKHISFGIISVILTYFLIIFSVRFLKQKQFRDLAFCLVAIICIQSYIIYSNYNTSNGFTIFHKSRHTVLGFKEHNVLTTHHNLNVLKSETFISNYNVGENINHISEDSIKSIYAINDKLLLIVDSLGVYKTSFKPDMVLLRNSPKVNLVRLINHLQPEVIIADGSNYKSYVARWEATCKTKKLPFHATAEKGALTIDYTN